MYCGEETLVPSLDRQQGLSPYQRVLVAGVDRTEPGSGAVAEVTGTGAVSAARRWRMAMSNA